MRRDPHPHQIDHLSCRLVMACVYVLNLLYTVCFIDKYKHICSQSLGHLIYLFLLSLSKDDKVTEIKCLRLFWGNNFVGEILCFMTSLKVCALDITLLNLFKPGIDFWIFFFFLNSVALYVTTLKCRAVEIHGLIFLFFKDYRMSTFSCVWRVDKVLI